MSNTGTELPLLKLGDKYQIQTLNDVMLLQNASERTYQLSRFNDRQLDELSVRAKNELREYTRNALQTRDGRKPSESDVQEEILAMGTHYDRGDPNDPLMNENISLMLIGFMKNVERLRSGRSKSVGEVRDAAGKAVSGIKKEVHGEKVHSVSTQAPAPVETSVPKLVTVSKPAAEPAPVAAPSAPVVVPKPAEKPVTVAAPAAPTPGVVQKPAEKPVPATPPSIPAPMPPLKAPSVLVTPPAVPKAPAPKVEVDTKRPETKSAEAPTAPKAPEKITVPDDLFGGAPVVPSAPAKKPDSVPEKAQAVPVPASKPVPAAEPVKPTEPAKPAAPLPAAEPAKVPAEKVAEPASGEKMRRKFFNALPSSLGSMREEIMQRYENAGWNLAQTPEKIKTVDLGSDPESRARNLLAHGVRPDFQKYHKYREAQTMFVATLKPTNGENAQELLIFVSNLGGANAKLTGIDLQSK